MIDVINVFNIFLDNTADYRFTDLDIARGSSSDWSYPNWPSHLDHILINKNLFDEFADTDSHIETIKLDGYYNGGFNEYDFKVTDHRPVGLKLGAIVSSTDELNSLDLNIYPNPHGTILKGRLQRISKLYRQKYIGSNSSIWSDGLNDRLGFIIRWHLLSNSREQKWRSPIIENIDQSDNEIF